MEAETDRASLVVGERMAEIREALSELGHFRDAVTLLEGYIDRVQKQVDAMTSAYRNAEDLFHSTRYGLSGARKDIEELRRGLARLAADLPAASEVG